MPELETSTVRLAYDVDGDAARPAILFGHGLYFDRALFRAVAAGLATPHRGIFIDARGHGGSSATRSFTLDDLAQDWRDVLDREGIARAVLVGHSMGGMTAMRFALRFPERVRALVLVNTSADIERRHPRRRNLAFAELASLTGTVRPFDGVIARLCFSPGFRAAHPDVVDEAMRPVRAIDGRAVRGAVRATFGRASIVDRLPDIGAPTLVVSGSADRLTPRARSEELARGIPGARLVVLEGTGHMAMHEAKDALGHAIDAFLAEIDDERG